MNTLNYCELKISTAQPLSQVGYLLFGMRKLIVKRIKQDKRLEGKNP